MTGFNFDELEDLESYSKPMTGKEIRIMYDMDKKPKMSWWEADRLK